VGTGVVVLGVGVWKEGKEGVGRGECEGGGRSKPKWRGLF